jgi:hypothetical protein
MHGEIVMQNRPNISAALILASAMGQPEKRTKTWIEEIDINKEYELIQQKKSKLTKSRRDAVVRAWNKSQ